MTETKNILDLVAKPCTKCGKTHPIEPGQVPPGVLDRLEYHRGQLRWTAELFDWMKEDGPQSCASPDDYPGAWTSLCDALFNWKESEHDSVNRQTPATALVVGSLSPWIECLILDMFPKCQITTTDHNPIEIHHDRVRYRPPRTAYDSRYDLIVSYSSVEHFGLGRYGDPLNADADLEWMGMIRGCVAPGGRLVLAVPQGPVDFVDECWHRIYGPVRMGELLAGWTIANKRFSREPVRHDWQNQPILTLVPA